MLDFGGMSSTNLLEGHKHIFTLMKSLKKIAGLFKKDRLHRIMVMKLTVLVFMVALFTVTDRCLRLCGGVVLTAVL